MYFVRNRFELQFLEKQPRKQIHSELIISFCFWNTEIMMHVLIDIKLIVYYASWNQIDHDMDLLWCKDAVFQQKVIKIDEVLGKLRNPLS
jgi:hypothetical protein